MVLVDRLLVVNDLAAVDLQRLSGCSAEAVSLVASPRLGRALDSLLLFVQKVLSLNIWHAFDCLSRRAVVFSFNISFDMSGHFGSSACHQVFKFVRFTCQLSIIVAFYLLQVHKVLLLTEFDSLVHRGGPFGLKVGSVILNGVEADSRTLIHPRLTVTIHITLLIRWLQN